MMTHKPASEVQSMVDEITQNVEALAAEDSKFYYRKELRTEAGEWAELFRSGLPDCCSGHRLDALRDIEQDLVTAVTICSKTDCNNLLQHEFLMDIAHIINNAGYRFMQSYSIKMMLDERKN